MKTTLFVLAGSFLSGQVYAKSKLLDTLIQGLNQEVGLDQIQVDEEDCEYEYIDVLSCMEPLDTAIGEFFSSLPLDQQAAVLELFFTYEYLNSEEFGEALADIIGEAAICTDEIVPLLDLFITCILPSCLNCENDLTGLKFFVEQYREGLLNELGCTFTFEVCPETDAPSASPTRPPVDDSEDEQDLGEVAFWLSAIALFLSLFAVILLLLSLRKKPMYEVEKCKVNVEAKQIL
eukprot:augustus_masked-scaffold_2-processed-gene-26.4-mRNA-1 protein AED:1.00 eAED:1.00 QI:0/-1/0/0/-1/1/1/0/233